MLGHPGGADHTRYLIELSFLKPPARWLDLGAGAGEAVALLKEAGFDAQGLDLSPRGEGVCQGDFLHTAFPDASFDGLISQCAFYVSGDVAGALREAGRLLPKGGKLVFSDVTEDVTTLLTQVRQGGFAVRHLEDLTDSWREYYLEALWREDSVCTLPKGKHVSYVLFVCERM